jgi:hypothetical protein
MSKLVDANDRPIQTEEQQQEAPKNGQNHDKQTQDVRAAPTGTLIYTLMRYTIDEVGLDNICHQLEMLKAQAKMVQDPPELERARHRLQQIQAHRYVLARELNERYADVDLARCKALGIEQWLPPGDREVAQAEAPAAADEQAD